MRKAQRTSGVYTECLKSLVPYPDYPHTANATFSFFRLIKRSNNKIKITQSMQLYRST